jgi:hypothetical protein
MGRVNKRIPDMVDTTREKANVTWTYSWDFILRHPRADKESINLSNIKLKETLECLGQGLCFHLRCILCHLVCLLVIEVSKLIF